ncbi:MAG: PTS sugar transporter subunit IIA [Betaproteobacteria bacterium]|nr:PTS sugar transporter subunit IIA [Betaproteobacteria bacterium]
MNHTAVLLIAHAPLASALRSVAEHVYPDCAARLCALDVPPGLPPAQIEEQAKALLAKLPQQEVLVLTDVFGATPCNVAQRLTDHRRIRVVTGVNVPMLWRVLCYEQESAERLAERAVSGATQGVMPVEARAPQFQELRVHHGQDRHHDQ